MLIDVDPELLMSVVDTIEASLEVLDGDTPSPSLKAALAASRTLTVLVGGYFANTTLDDEEVEKPATDSPETCGHPRTIELPGQTMCESCGASRNPDSSWSVW